MFIVTSSRIVDSILSRIRSIYEIFGGLCYEEYTPVFSFNGITIVIRFAFATLFIVVLAMAIIRAFKDNESNVIYKHIAVMLAINLFVVILTDEGGTSRYMLVSIVPSFLIFSDYANKLLCNIKERNYRVIFSVCAFLLMGTILLISNKKVLQDDAYPNFTSDLAKFQQVLDVINREPEENVFVMDDEGQAELYRLMNYDVKKYFVTYLSESNTLAVDGFYWLDLYYDWLNEPFILVVCNSYTSIDKLPEVFRDRCQQIDRVQNYEIYRVN